VSAAPQHQCRRRVAASAHRAVLLCRREIDVHGNTLSGAIPASLFAAPFLTCVALSQLLRVCASVCYPPSSNDDARWHAVCYRSVVSLSENQLAGTIPTTIASKNVRFVTAAVVVAAHRMRCTHLGRCVPCSVFKAAANLLTGPLPDAVGNLPALT
jgi:hypothetical protein